MTLWSASSNAITPALKVARAANQGLSKALSAIMPKGLYVRALVIVIAPMVLLQSILAYVFMERHWQTVTERLSAALSFRASTVFGVWGYPMGRVVLAYEMIKGARDPMLSIAAS